MADSPIGTQPPRADLMADILQANEAPSSDVANIQPSNNVFDVDKDRAPIKILSKMQRTRNAGNSIFGTKPGSPVRSLHVLALHDCYRCILPSFGQPRRHANS